MSQNVSNAKVVIKLSCWQAITSVFLALGLLIFFDKEQALSALLGGLICAVANLFFFSRLYLTTADEEPEKILKRFFRGEKLKVVFTLAMFAFSIAVIKVSFLPFILSYILAAVVVNWLFLRWG